eukprot:361013-Chlamydomonas_euryale.AAC.8
MKQWAVGRARRGLLHGRLAEGNGRHGGFERCRQGSTAAGADKLKELPERRAQRAFYVMCFARVWPNAALRWDSEKAIQPAWQPTPNLELRATGRRAHPNHARPKHGMYGGRALSLARVFFRPRGPCGLQGRDAIRGRGLGIAHLGTGRIGGSATLRAFSFPPRSARDGDTKHYHVQLEILSARQLRDLLRTPCGRPPLAKTVMTPAEEGTPTQPSNWHARLSNKPQSVRSPATTQPASSQGLSPVPKPRRLECKRRLRCAPCHVPLCLQRAARRRPQRVARRSDAGEATRRGPPPPK